MQASAADLLLGNSVAELHVDPVPAMDASDPSLPLTLHVKQAVTSTGILQPALVVGIGEFGRRALEQLRRELVERYGSMSFGDVAQAAIRLARDGFPADPRFCDTFTSNEAKYRRFAGNAQVFLPGGSPPRPGQIFRQTDLARSLQYMVDAERAAAAKGRAAGLAAAAGGRSLAAR